ncbi:aspartyl protease family protein [Nonomuraea sp. NPDC050383]|uniref:aspartyl protease family protein n=1 Tax=Nonomuraea sp. NPDC050383 TaxID=3364362 RepID=UPI0037BE12B4
MPLSDDLRNTGRRAFLRRASLAVAASAALPLLGSTPSEAFAAADDDPDQLFTMGRFAAAERGYRRLLREDPRDAHALAQVGYLALLSNRFADAEKHLSKAVTLQPNDVASTQRLAECFVRQDQLARAVPLLKSIDRPRDKALSELYSRISGTPWQIHGARSTRVPFVTLDPVPAVEAALNGGKPQKFWLDTYATLDLSREVAEEAGLRAVTTMSGGVANNQPITIWLGVLDSFTIGNIEIRNLPVQWSDARRPSLPDGTPAAGAFGTTIFYHFLTTMDYAGRALTLRRKTRTTPRAHAADRLPLWLAGDHYPCTLGSLGDYGPRMVTVDTGGIGIGLDTTTAIAQKTGMKVDYDHPLEQPGGVKIYPITAERISLGGAVGRDLPGHAADKVFPGFPGPGQSAQFGFELIANFTHEFFKPFAITFDYTGMHLSITRA